MRNLLYFLFILLSIGCVERESVHHLLDVADNLMESSPDTALTILSSIDTNFLNSREDKARFAMLYSMARERNLIRTKTFEILQPAIDYYLLQKPSNESLRTLYYQGAIYMDRGERDKAMNSFVRALDIAPKCTDTMTIIRTLIAQSIIFRELYDPQRQFGNYYEAAELARKKGLWGIYYNCLLRAYGTSVGYENKQLADSLNAVLVQAVRDGHLPKRQFIPYLLNYLSEYGNDEEIQAALKASDSITDKGQNDWIAEAQAYLSLGESEKGISKLEDLRMSGITYDTARYFGTKMALEELSGNYKQALEDYRTFGDIMEREYREMYEQKLQSSEDRSKMEIQEQKNAREKANMRWGVTVCAIVLLTGFVITMLYARNMRLAKTKAESDLRVSQLESDLKMSQLENDLKMSQLEEANLRSRVATLEGECENLEELLTKKNLPEPVRGVIKERLEILNALIASEITGDDKYARPYQKWMNSLTSTTQSFMEANRLALEEAYPEFMNYLHEHGLTREEMEYVGLYTLGLKGKEIGTYLKRPSHINLSSEIRRKLGLEKTDTNLGIYVRALLAKMTP